MWSDIIGVCLSPINKCLPWEMCTFTGQVWKFNCFSVRKNPWTTLYLWIFTWITLNLHETPSLSVHSPELHMFFGRILLVCWTTNYMCLIFSLFFPTDCSSGNNKLIWLLQSTEKPSVNVKLVYGSCGKLNPD